MFCAERSVSFAVLLNLSRICCAAATCFASTSTTNLARSAIVGNFLSSYVERLEKHAMGDKLALAAALGIFGLGALAEDPAKPTTSAPQTPEVRVWAPPIQPEPSPLLAV